MPSLILIFLVAVLNLNSAFAEEEMKTLHFGILSFRPKDITAAKWQPLTQELERNLPGYKIELHALTYPELDKAAKTQQLDFVLTNPEHYILLKNIINMNAVATLITLDQGHPITDFAGVIFTRANRADIQTLEDLQDKKIAAPAEQSLGGYLMERWELEKNNITAKDYIFTGMPHDKVVDEVLSGRVDAGFVRSGVLESLEKVGKIQLGENASIRVIAQHEFNADDTNHRIYSLHSTAHYPEWAFNVRKNINPEISRKVSLTLLNIKPDSEIAKSAEIAGFNSPADYTPVEVLMLRLRAHPDELKYFNFSDVIWRYREGTLILVIISLFIATLIIFLIRANRKSKKMQKRLNESKNRLQTIIEANPECMQIVDKDGKVLQINSAGLKMIEADSIEQVVNKSTINLVVPQYREKMNELHQRVFTGETANVQLEIVGLKGTRRWMDIHSVPMIDNGNVVRLSVTRDITENKKYEAIIQQLAFFDALTGLPNRRKLLDSLAHSISLSHREHKKLAIFMMDLDKFKAVNDTLGHAAGDDLLKQVAERIPLYLRESDIVARLGGDEFVIVLEHVNSANDAAKVATKVIEELTKPFTLISGETVQIGASIGISFYPQHGDSAEKLIDCADTALYFAKGNGRGCFAYYEKQPLNF